MTTKFIIQTQKNTWLAKRGGGFIETPSEKRAKVFDTSGEAEAALAQVKKSRPMRNYEDVKVVRIDWEGE